MLTILMGLFVRAMLSSQKAAAEASRAADERYQAEIARLQAERDRREAELVAEVERWKGLYLGVIGGQR